MTFSTIPIGRSVGNKRSNPGEIIEGVSIRQTVPVQEINHANSICYDIMFATYYRTNPARLKVSLTQNDYAQTIFLNASVLKDNASYSLCFSSKGLTPGVADLEISGFDGLPGKSPTVWLATDIPNGGVTINGKKMEGGLIFDAYVKSYFFIIVFFAIVIMSVFAVWIAILFLNNKSIAEYTIQWWSRLGNSRAIEFLTGVIDMRATIFLYAMIALTLAISMATVSRFKVTNPDEGVHASSARYYETYFLPPVVGDPIAKSTYCTSYGVSYINQIGINYLLIGKFTRLIRLITHSDSLILYRSFNLFLFFILCIIGCISKDRMIFFPLIITPQLWYVASYTNNDFFPFFVMMLICYEFMKPESLYNKGIRTQSLYSSLPAGGLLGILAISKANYLVFAMFAGFYLIWNSLRLNRFSVDRDLFLSSPFKSMVIILICTSSIYTIRTGFDIYQNGFDKASKLKQYANEVGAKGFRPIDLKADINNTYRGLCLKEKGVSLYEMIILRNWYTTSVNSFFGIYGGMNISAKKNYYYWISFVFYSLILYTIIRITVDFKRENVILTAGAIFFIVLMVCASVHNSWIYDFQPQGRYLFPILGIMSVMVYQNRAMLNRHVVGLMIFLMFLSSVWSFLFVGIYRIDKIVM